MSSRFLLVPLVLLVGCSHDYDARALEPKLELSTSTIDFGEVVVGKQSEVGILLENTGGGTLLIEGFELDGTTSADFSLLDLESDSVEPGEDITIGARYVPDVVGQDYGNIAITSNDPEDPLTQVALVGFGVEPRIDLDPETLWFGDVAIADTESLEVTVGAVGTGTVWIDSIQFEDDMDAFSMELPEEVSEFPYALQGGFSFVVTVNFTPLADTSYDSNLLFISNDPTEPTSAVRLLGNTEENPDGNEAPTVEITDPNWGNYLVAGEPVELAGVVVDLEDDPTSLVCYWYVSDDAGGMIPIDDGEPNESGEISNTTSDLPPGDRTITLIAMDTDQATGMDSVDVVVWDPEEELRYTIAGGETVYHYWSVDDDIDISLNGVFIFQDRNHTQDTHPPVEFEAEVGDIITIEANDYNECKKEIDPLYLHFGTGTYIQLNDAICDSACSEDACYSGSYMGPWPNIFLQEDYEITIP